MLMRGAAEGAREPLDRAREIGELDGEHVVHDHERARVADQVLGGVRVGDDQADDGVIDQVRDADRLDVDVVRGEIAAHRPRASPACCRGRPTVVVPPASFHLYPPSVLTMH